MNSVISNQNKKEFLRWFTKKYKLKNRESLWILDFLYSHDSMLGKTHFVENVDQAPRGIYMSVEGTDHPSFIFYKNGHVYKDPIQAFHEVRLNWSSELYIEIDFEDAWQSLKYLGVLEDNPYASWNSQVSEDLVDKMGQALIYASLEAKKQTILHQIDELLKTGTEEQFIELAKNFEKIEERIREMSLSD